MKLLRLFLGLGALAFSGCGHLDLAPEGDPNRVLAGTVNLRMPMDLPADASVLVRIVDNSRADAPQILGEQTSARVNATPVPFRVEFRAEDAVLRRGLNVEARVSYGGSLRYYTAKAVGLNLGNYDRPMVVVVDPVKR